MEFLLAHRNVDSLRSAHHFGGRFRPFGKPVVHHHYSAEQSSGRVGGRSRGHLHGCHIFPGHYVMEIEAQVVYLLLCLRLRLSYVQAKQQQ